MSPKRPLTFDPCFGKLGREIVRFANHTERFVRVSQQNRGELVAASEAASGLAPLDHAPQDPKAALRQLAEFATTLGKDQTKLVGSYFAHHHIRNQAELSRSLLRESLKSEPAQRVAHSYVVNERAHQTRRLWVSAFIEVMIEISAPELSSDSYAVFNVGALTDHEDIDLAFVVSGEDARESFAKGFAPLSKAFVRYASKIQLFLADQLPNGYAGNTIEEYEQIVAERVGVVVPLQFLGAQFLAGSPDLSRRFMERITQRYYAESGDPAAHEELLREIMLEMRHYQVIDRIGEVLAPKREVYMPAKLVTAAMRTIHGVYEPRPSMALGLLAERDPQRREAYLTLRDAFVQNEVLRALLFLYVSKSAEADLFDPLTQRSARRVAVLLGLGGSARRSAETRLLAYFQDIRARALGSVFELSFDIGRHLRSISTFKSLLDAGPRFEDTDRNLALGLLDTLTRYPRGIFWDEVVEHLSSSEALFDRFLDDLGEVPLVERREIAKRYAAMMCGDASSLVEFLILVSTHESERGDGRLGTNLDLFFDAMLNALSESEERLSRFVYRLDDETETEALFRLAHALPPRRIAELAHLIETKAPGSLGERVVRSLRSVIVLAHHHSGGLGRVTNRVLGRTPEFVQRLGDFERLRSLARDLRTQAPRELNPEERIELLGDAFDAEVLRIALVSVLEAAPPERDADFIRAFDAYVRELFTSSYQKVKERSPVLAGYSPQTDFALFATGGIGREEAFAADWDYLAVIGSEDGKRKKFLGKIVQRLEAALVRRGISPHNRLTPVFNAYVVSISELRSLLEARGPEAFIDQAEVLEARFMLGDPEIEDRFEHELRSMVRKRAKQFAEDVVFEINAHRTDGARPLDIKLGEGGLREIQLLGLAAGAHFVKSGRVSPETQLELAAEPRIAAFAELTRCSEVLRRIRDLHRLLVSFDDPLQPEALLRLASDLPSLSAFGPPEHLAEVTRAHMARAARVVSSISAAVLEYGADTASSGESLAEG